MEAEIMVLVTPSKKSFFTLSHDTANISPHYASEMHGQYAACNTGQPIT